MMPRSASLALIVVVVGLVLVGSAGAAAPAEGTAHPAIAETDGENGTAGNTTIRSQSAALETAGANESDASAELYFVAENGTWYQATANGSVGDRAPDGDELRLLGQSDTQTSDTPTVNSSQLDPPGYVWKVRTGCTNVFVDGASGETASVLAVPGCSQLQKTPPATTATQSTTRATRRSTEATRTSRGSGPGFGSVLTLVGVLAGAGLASRR